jgi:hypothetical protein
VAGMRQASGHRNTPIVPDITAYMYVHVARGTYMGYMWQVRAVGAMYGQELICGKYFRNGTHATHYTLCLWACKAYPYSLPTPN